jgi:hypothetical protein
MVGTSGIEESDAGSIMSTRHVAALALVGWYLMTPPPRINEMFDERRPRPRK